MYSYSTSKVSNSKSIRESDWERFTKYAKYVRDVEFGDEFLMFLRNEGVLADVNQPLFPVIRRLKTTWTNSLLEKLPLLLQPSLRSLTIVVADTTERLENIATRCPHLRTLQIEMPTLPVLLPMSGILTLLCGLDDLTEVILPLPCYQSF